jgi:hypothetical protein
MDANFELKTRIDTAFFEIIQLAPNTRRDLQKMWRVARDKWNEMDQELVTCRRTHKITPKYKMLEQSLQEHLDTIERYLTFALLTK